MSKRTKLKERILPFYTKGEEIMSMTTHIVGGAFGVAILVLCVIRAAIHHSAWGVVSAAIYGACMTVTYTMSSIYHGLRRNTGKKVMQILDHCSIYFLIAGTYTPVTLCALRPEHTALAWSIFGIEWGLTALAAALTAIDLKMYKTFSLICYIIMGWVIILFTKTAIETVSYAGFMFLLAGGIAYTVGSVLYSLGKKVRWMHSVFHIFVVLGSVLQFFAIFFYVL